MKAIILDRYGRKVALRAGEIGDPEVREDDVLVQVYAAGVNLLDSKIRSGEFKLILPYRLPIVLCDLEGKTRKQAARQIGWPEGTVATRLQQGRALVQKRLARHGLGVWAGAEVAVPITAPSVIEELAAQYGGRVVRTKSDYVSLMDHAVHHKEGLAFAGDDAGPLRRGPGRRPWPVHSCASAARPRDPRADRRA